MSGKKEKKPVKSSDILSSSKHKKEDHDRLDALLDAGSSESVK